MAESLSHKFGQIIGDLLESAIIEYCKPIAEKYDMYLDSKHSRAARNNQREVRWTDINDNTHKLDIVIEDGGDEYKFGKPRGFIEVAWRRYTKHSKNKAQEISAAIVPLVAKYQKYAPFFGAVLAGEFTENSLNQLRSEGFELLYFSIKAIENAFASVGIDAHWESKTPEKDFQTKIEQYNQLSEEQVDTIIQTLMRDNADQLNDFKLCLCSSLERTLQKIRVISLFGNQQVFNCVQDACAYILSCSENIPPVDFYRFEILVSYSNGDKIEMQFKERQTALAYLNQLV